MIRNQFYHLLSLAETRCLMKIMSCFGKISRYSDSMCMLEIRNPKTSTTIYSTSIYKMFRYLSIYTNEVRHYGTVQCY